MPPDRSTQKIPFSTRRSSTRGTPRGLLGNSGSITCHSKSVTSYWLMPTLNHVSVRRERACCLAVKMLRSSHAPDRSKAPNPRRSLGRPRNVASAAWLVECDLAGVRILLSRYDRSTARPALYRLTI